MRYKLLGDLEIIESDGRRVEISAPKVATVIALLLACRNQLVTVQSLACELWGDRPPRSASTTLQTYIYHARKAFEINSPCSAQMIETQSAGYLFRVEPGQLDVDDFERFARRGRDHLASDCPEQALTDLREALGLWRGPALASVDRGDLLGTHAAHLEERRLEVIEARITAERRLGTCRELIPELRTLIAAHPLHEWFYGQLIDTLTRSGRRAEAHRVYVELRRIFRQELDVEPSLRLAGIPCRDDDQPR